MLITINIFKAQFSRNKNYNYQNNYLIITELQLKTKLGKRIMRLI